MSILNHLEGFVGEKIKAVSTILSIIKLETRLAQLSIYPLIINLCFVLVAFVTVWGSLMILIAYLMLLVYPNFLATLLLIVLLNLSIAIGLLKYLTFNLKNMSFAKTRAIFARNEGHHHENLKKNINDTNPNVRKKITATEK